MKKSRLRLFKSTSMLIGVVGIILLISIILVAGYIGFSMVSNGITSEISSGTQYDELASLKTQYDNLSSKFDLIKSKYSGDPEKMTEYDTAKIELERAKTAISNAQSALDSGKPSAEVDARLNDAKEKLAAAEQAYQKLA